MSLKKGRAVIKKIYVKVIKTQSHLESGIFWCDHADTETVELDYGHPDQNIGDYVDDWRVSSVCAGCGAVYDEWSNTFEECNL